MIKLIFFISKQRKECDDAKNQFLFATQVWDRDGRLINGPDLFAEDEKDDRKKRFLPTKRVLWALASTVDAAKRDSIMTAFEVRKVVCSLRIQDPERFVIAGESGSGVIE